MSRLVATAFVLASLTSAFAALRPAQEMQMPQPTPEHAELLKGVGEWEGTLTTFMPGAPEASTPCKETVTAIGPFWTTSTFTCEWGGMPFVGTGVTGYDPERKVFVGTWVDAVSTFLTVMEGRMDPAKKALVMSYTAPNPMDGKLTPHRVETVRSGDSYTSTFYMGEGEGQKHMAIAMKRKK